MSSITTPTVQSSPETGTTNIVEPEVQPELETSQENETTESIATQTTSTPFQGDGTDPSQAALLIPQRTLTEWLTYSISLNYNRLATSVLSPITHWQWYNRIPHTNVILGAVPSQQILVQLQREQRLENVVNMCAEFNGHIETMNDLGLVQCWIPTRDFQTPSLDSIWTGVRFMSKCGTRWQGLEESKRGTLYIHCKAGRGRSATVALCWLLFAYKLTPIQAQQALLGARGQVDKNIHLHPEVISFYDQVLEQESNNTITRIDWLDV